MGKRESNPTPSLVPLTYEKKNGIDPPTPPQYLSPRKSSVISAYSLRRQITIPWEERVAEHKKLAATHKSSLRREVESKGEPEDPSSELYTPDPTLSTSTHPKGCHFLAVCVRHTLKVNLRVEEPERAKLSN